jgi:hypothetical protein
VFEGESAAQERRLGQRQVDHDRTLAAMQALEAALARPAPGREASWRKVVAGALGVLVEATSDEAENAMQPDSLLSDLASSQPRLRNRVRSLRLQYRQLQQTVASLESEIAGGDQSSIDFADVRHRLSVVLEGLRHQRARESDLIYEAYYDAFKSDLPRDVDRELGGP